MPITVDPFSFPVATMSYISIRRWSCQAIVPSKFPIMMTFHIPNNLAYGPTQHARVPQGFAVLLVKLEPPDVWSHAVRTRHDRALMSSTVIGTLF